MSIKVFKTNKAGKIEFTRCELEKLLNETYNEGYRDGENHAKSNYWTWTSPSIVNTPYYGTTITCDNGSTIRSNAVSGYPDISGTVTLADKVTGSNDVATNATSAVSATPNTNAIKVDICSSADSKTPEIAKATVKETPAKTYEVKGMTYNMDDLVKTVDALLSGKSVFDLGLYAHPDLNGAKKAVENDAFTNLAKELRGL